MVLVGAFGYSVQLIACNVVQSIRPFFKEVRETKTHSACLLIST